MSICFLIDLLICADLQPSFSLLDATATSNKVMADLPPPRNLTSEENVLVNKVMTAARKGEWKHAYSKFQKEKYKTETVLFELARQLVNDLFKGYDPKTLLPWQKNTIVSCLYAWNVLADPVAAKINFWRHYFRSGQVHKLDVLTNTDFFGFNYSARKYIIADMYQEFIRISDMDGMNWVESYNDPYGHWHLAVLMVALSNGRFDFFNQQILDTDLKNNKFLQALFKHLKEPSVKSYIKQFWNFISMNCKRNILKETVTQSQSGADLELVAYYREDSVMTEEFKKELIELDGKKPIPNQNPLEYSESLVAKILEKPSPLPGQFSPTNSD